MEEKCSEQKCENLRSSEVFYFLNLANIGGLPPVSYPGSCQYISALPCACLNGCLLLTLEKDLIHQPRVSYARG